MAKNVDTFPLVPMVIRLAQYGVWLINHSTCFKSRRVSPIMPLIFADKIEPTIDGDLESNLTGFDSFHNQNCKPPVRFLILQSKMYREVSS